MGKRATPAQETSPREACCRALMGKGVKNWATSYEMTATQIMHSLEMLEDGSFPPAIVVDCSDLLQRWGWFRKAGLATKPPWEITNDDWAKLIEIAPWEKRPPGGCEGQGKLFGLEPV